MELEKGSQLLVGDLKALLAEAEAGEFGDFTNEKYATPRIELDKRLDAIKQNNREGKYDG